MVTLTVDNGDNYSDSKQFQAADDQWMQFSISFNSADNSIAWGDKLRFTVRIDGVTGAESDITYLYDPSLKKTVLT